MPHRPAPAPRRRAAAPGVAATVDGRQVVWTPGAYGEDGYLVCDDDLAARIGAVIAARTWAPVLGVTVLAAADSAVGVLAALYAVAPTGVQVQSVPDEALVWLTEQKRRAAWPS